MIEIDIEKENKAIAQEYKELLRISYQTLTPEDKKLIRKAFDVAVDAHKEQRRKSGEAYIFHPIAVAKIVASEIGLGATSIAAALLHDVVEDTPMTVEDIERMFNPKVAQLGRRIDQNFYGSKRFECFDAGRKFPKNDS